MKNWQIFERECVSFLNDKYGNYFRLLGNSDSTLPDIFFSNNNRFCIEVKMANAQCGQFVLFPNAEKQAFEYSTKNKTKYNQDTQRIIDYMNEHYAYFAESTTKGKEINIDQKILFDWIKYTYQSKSYQGYSNRYFMTQGNDYIIFPIERIEQYFTASATYRIKRSGSSPMAKSNIPDLELALQKTNINYDLINKDLTISSDEELDKKTIQGYKNKYLLVKEKPAEYKVRKLSKTSNANIIFTIKLIAKSAQRHSDLIEFENALK